MVVVQSEYLDVSASDFNTFFSYRIFSFQSSDTSPKLDSRNCMRDLLYNFSVNFTPNYTTFFISLTRILRDYIYTVVKKNPRKIAAAKKRFSSG